MEITSSPQGCFPPGCTAPALDRSILLYCFLAYRYLALANSISHASWDQLYGVLCWKEAEASSKLFRRESVIN